MKNSTPRPESQRSLMVFAMGLPAAGKTTKVRALYPEAVRIDPDLFKERHPNYDPTHPELLHTWSMDRAEAKFEEALDSRCFDFIIDGTGTNSDRMVRRMKRASAAGFRVALVYVRCTLETSIRRNAARERNVPEHVIRAKALDIATAFELAAPYADSVHVIENNSDQKEA